MTVTPPSWIHTSCAPLIKSSSRSRSKLAVLGWIGALIMSSITLHHAPRASAQTTLTPLTLEKTCITESSPRGLSLIVTPDRVSHLIYFSPFGELFHRTVDELSGQLTSSRTLITELTAPLEHTRAAPLSDGFAFCYYDASAPAGIRVVEVRGSQRVSGVTLLSDGPTHCDIASDGSSLYVSAIIEGTLQVMTGVEVAGERVWSAATSVLNAGGAELSDRWRDLEGHSAIARSAGRLWVGAQRTEGNIALASRSLSDATWTDVEVPDPLINLGRLGDQLRLSSRRGAFAGEVWATHTPVTASSSDDLGFIVTELFVGAWDTYKPLNNRAVGKFHDAFGGPAIGDNEGYLYVVTREYQRNAVFGSADALLLLRYESTTSNPNTQVLEQPILNTRRVYSAIGAAPDPLADVIAFAYYSDPNLGGQLCRWSTPDRDHDALPDAYELTLGSDPDLSDTDGDGLSDGFEVLVSESDPLLSDAPTGASCDDRLRNQDETGVDCGGATCAPCADGVGCLEARDCVSALCLRDTGLADDVLGVCASPSCEDGLVNQDESDVDCGGATCSPCAEGAQCEVNHDCLSVLCLAGRCAEPSCDDQIRNQDESDVDCGGVCGACSEGAQCGDDSDCSTALCLENLCVTPSCDDGRRNQDESDVDCGGVTCASCAHGSRCDADSDCLSAQCLSNVCVEVGCEDGVISAGESDVDCGGLSCAPCPDTSTCVADRDCESGFCGGGRCATPRCDDAARNQDETDIDCGGVTCAPCNSGSRCERSRDCAGLICEAGRCAEPSCTDRARNQDETDIDCGGVTCAPCNSGSHCQAHDDCASGRCAGGVCVNASCEDALLNQGESDVDCGGGVCAACIDGRRCDLNSDCAGGQCLFSVCVSPSCRDGVRSRDESDVDCGGASCERCVESQRCAVNADCASRICVPRDTGATCAGSTCEDVVQNGAETDVDCGGPLCEVCPVGYTCLEGRDCSSGVCGPDSRCQPPRCDDAVLNGDEVNVDCGGTCDGCALGATCEVNSDCLSGRCFSGRCAPPSCDDGLLNQGEVEVDCGGPCAPCGAVELDMALPVDMSLLDMSGEPLTDATLEPDMDLTPDSDPFDVDMEVEPPLDEGVVETMDQATPLPIDQAIPVGDQEPIEEPLDRGVVELGDMGSPSVDMSATGMTPSEGGSEGDPDPTPPAAGGRGGYDPSIFQRERKNQGCDAGGSSHTRGPLEGLNGLWLVLLLALARSRRCLIRA